MFYKDHSTKQTETSDAHEELLAQRDEQIAALLERQQELERDLEDKDEELQSLKSEHEDLKTEAKELVDKVLDLSETASDVHTALEAEFSHTTIDGRPVSWDKDIGDVHDLGEEARDAAEDIRKKWFPEDIPPEDPTEAGKASLSEAGTAATELQAE